MHPLIVARRMRGAGAPDFLAQTARECGDVARLPLPHTTLFLISHPELSREVLLTHGQRWRKGRAIQITRHLLGEGLLTAEGAYHLKQRRLLQPSFLPRSLPRYADAMVQSAEEVSRSWQDGAVVDIAAEMNQLALRIAGRTLFSSEVGNEAEVIARSLNRTLGYFEVLLMPFGKWIESQRWFERLWERERAHMNEVIYGLITRRRRTRQERLENENVGDVLDLLLSVRYDDGSALSDEQIRDEALTLLLGGHETTANALAWMWWLLGAHPEVEQKLQEEADAVLNGHRATYEDFARLAYTRQVVSEAMRLFPPAWALGRELTEDVVLAHEGARYRLPQGATVLLSPYVLHHDPRFWNEPLRFDPERFAPERVAARPKGIYLPFSTGTRGCIGEGFAWLELVLVTATLAQKWSAERLPDTRVGMQPRITLRPHPGIPMRLKRRGTA